MQNKVIAKNEQNQIADFLKREFTECHLESLVSNCKTEKDYKKHSPSIRNAIKVIQERLEYLNLLLHFHSIDRLIVKDNRAYKPFPIESLTENQ